MIDALSPLDWDDAYLRLREPLKVDLGIDRSKLTRLTRAHRELLRATVAHTDPVRVLELVTQMISGCAGLGMFGGDLDSRFGIDLADIWLSRNGYILLPETHERVALLECLVRVPTLPRLPRNSQLDAVRSWAGRNIAEAATGATLAARAGLDDSRLLLRCFVGCPMTAVPGHDARRSIRELCDTAGSVLSEHGILVYQPAFYTAPEVTPVDRDDPVYRSIDEDLIAASDMVLLVAERPSSGLGVVASMAHRYRKHLVVATSATVSPMIAGLDPPPAILRLDTLASDLHGHLTVVRGRLEECSGRTRQEISRIEIEQARLRRRFNRMTTDEIGRPRNVVMNRTRFRDLMNRPELFAGATVLEVRELYRLAGE